MTIELYVFPPSPRAFKVMAVANHLGIDWTMRVVDLAKGEQQSPEFAALNPNMRMPVLKDGNYVLWESNAIAQYLADQRPEGGLLPADGKGRLDVTRWQFWDLAHWDPACAIFVFEYVAKPRFPGISEPDMAAIAKGTEMFHRVATVLDGQLKGKKFALGDELTLVDFSLCAAMNSEPRDAELRTRAPSVMRATQTCGRRKARVRGPGFRDFGWGAERPQ